MTDDKLATYPYTTTCPTLLSSERAELVRYILMAPDDRRILLNRSVMDARVSGSLIHAMRWLLTA